MKIGNTVVPEDEMVEAIKGKGSIFCSTGRINGYREAFLQGLGGSRKESTWNKSEHTCCGSKVFWRHKVKCPKLNF